MFEPEPTASVAVVTGAGSGIGAAVAEHLARAGMVVVAVDRDATALAEVAARLDGRGHAVHAVVADVSVAEQVDELFGGVARWGTVGVLVNNAGVTTTSSLHEMSDDEWRATFTACVTPVVLCGKAALRQMLRSGRGAIVNVASVHQRIAAPGLAAYTAAKGAIVALSKQVAVEYGGRGVRCNVVSPGWIRTPATEGRLRGGRDEQALRDGQASTRLGVPDDVAAAVAYLASPAAELVNGAELVVDGASSLITGAQMLRLSSTEWESSGSEE